MTTPPVSRGFRGRTRSAGAPNRLPPGQHLTTDFPVLSAGPTPRPNLETWRFALNHGGSILAEWSWKEFEALPQSAVTVDIHCAATVTCGGCGTAAYVGDVKVFGGPMGAIFRCVHCDAAVMRLVHTPAGFWLDMRGARSLHVDSQH